MALYHISNRRRSGAGQLPPLLGGFLAAGQAIREHGQEHRGREKVDAGQSYRVGELGGLVLAALKTVRDPEIPVDLVELGLIYELIVKKGGTVYVEMTLTTPSCPVAASMPGEVEAAVRAVPGVNDARVKLVWTPTWTPERMSEEAKLELGML